MTEDETPEADSSPKSEPLRSEDEAPEQFKRMRESLHAERDRVKDLAQDWRPVPMRDVRDVRSPQLLGETLLALGKPMSPVTLKDGTVRMQLSLGPLSVRQDLLEGISG